MFQIASNRCILIDAAPTSGSIHTRNVCGILSHESGHCALAHTATPAEWNDEGRLHGVGEVWSPLEVGMIWHTVPTANRWLRTFFPLALAVRPLDATPDFLGATIWNKVRITIPRLDIRCVK